MRDDDEHAEFERPRRRTRPRTKDRPDYSAAGIGQVVRIDRGRYTVVVDDVTVTAVTARALGRKAVIIGDRVRVVGDTSGRPDTLARIAEVEERTSVLRRTADDDDPVERDIVANADQMAVVVASADPPPRIGLVDRSLVAAYVAGIEPLVIVTKSDLAEPTEFLEQLRPLGVRSVRTRRDGDLSEVRALLREKTTVLVGHSGVGKSTLVNALVPEAHRETGSVNDTTGRGRHTSTSALALRLPEGGWIIDTPGIRSFGLAHVTPDDVIAAFDDLEAAVEQCSRGCTHAAGEPECGLDRAVETGDIDAERVASIRRLLAVG